MATRIGVDIGGTFTDLVVIDEGTGRCAVAKQQTRRDAPEEGVLTALANELNAEDRRRIALFMHGTTVGLNALLERRGATVGLLTTRGFRDVLAMRRGDRERIYDIAWQPPPPLVPRRLRLAVTERIRASGAVEVPLDARDVLDALAVFDAASVQAIAIVFLNSYANPVHEHEAVQTLRDAGFDGEISASSDLSREYREFERTSTTVVDAYIRPVVAAYLRRLESGLRKLDVSASCLITRSGGGVMLFGEAEGRPCETIMSGPVAGATGAGLICREIGIERAIAADVGGTSFDTCWIENGQPTIKFEGSVGGMPLQTPWVDVRSIGAGGGSIAFLDETGRLRVGPRSAGATPGPAAYGHGGVEPTVTDAAVVLGMFGGASLAGGLSLDVEAARRALGTLAARLGLGIEGLAQGVLSIAVASMAGAMRSVTVELGQDPRAAALIAFGGAGPLLATLLAGELDIPTIVVPPYAGNFSAWGLLGQDAVRSVSQTLIRELDDDALTEVNAVLRRLLDGLTAREGGAVDSAQPVEEAALDLRYAGQEHTLTLSGAWDSRRLGWSAKTLREDFEASYEQTFGTRLDGPAEIVAVRAALRLPLPRMAILDDAEPAGTSTARNANAFSFRLGAEVEFAVRERQTIAVGETLTGPAIIIEPTTTTYVDAGFVLARHASGALLIEHGEAA